MRVIYWHKHIFHEFILIFTGISCKNVFTIITVTIPSFLSFINTIQEINGAFWNIDYGQVSLSMKMHVIKINAVCIITLNFSILAG